MNRIMLLAFLTIVAVFMPAAAQNGKTNSNKIAAEVRAVLNTQVDAWNRGDIPGFMNGYHRSTRTVFISGDNVTHGWQTVLENYQKNYNSREKMGTLTFSDLDIDIMSNDIAVATGSWRLKRANDEPHGKFTLIFRKTRAGWKIVRDHTSSA